MKRESFLRGVVVAFIFAVFSAVGFIALKPVFGATLLLQWLIAACAGLYIVYLLSRSNEKSGRLAVPALWALGTIVIWHTVPGLTLFLLAHVGMVWLVRSLYFHAGILSALLDLALCAAAVLAAVAAARSSHSVFLSVWSFFLVQALFVAIPTVVSSKAPVPATDSNDQFHRALATAEAALRRLHTPR